jgi:ABC-type uncharacterized transport system substrate-binding protein
MPFLLRLSTLIRDPFVRRAFERAEREDGTAPDLVVNLKTAKSLGVTIPQAILARADEVIQ